MKMIQLGILLFATTFAFADMSSSQLDALAFETVVDAVLTQHKVAVRGGIRRIERSNTGFFKIQVVSPEGICQQLTAETMTIPSESELPKLRVTFTQALPSNCEN